MAWDTINYECIRCGISVKDIERSPAKCPGCDKCVKCNEGIKIINDGIKQCGCSTWVMP